LYLVDFTVTELGYDCLHFAGCVGVKDMTRDEAVKLVSRTIAVIQLVSALLNLTYLPAYLLSWSHPTQFGTNSIRASDYYTRLYTLELGALKPCPCYKAPWIEFFRSL
jgi:hypothetical protein